ncbi:RNA polymerase sigma-70 factor [Kitasatospora kifunensis]|uniref:RNA polymerase sigma-70 factor (ECF subfamily) n=1 Tax=Kitasatospora kifunensis TaxID=58351 RepID=A0A7W7VVS7_KITKI|nr:RNA polymerase sigma-70 factor [Kitasatospora kifunensis]MBB4924014.1 RNA polymerase sigma-70 factor (ECF subfamily) [Kitasatospora kifunensis]
MIDSGADDPFLEHRRLLFSAAYRLLGSVADAEDILQDAWLKWAAVDRTTVTHPKAYLVRTVTNLALNKLTSAQARREAYVGPWLPEPLLTEPDAADVAELADSVSLAMLVVLETLSPLERAVFVLREVFDYSNAEIAQALDKSEAAVRQTAHRAKAHVAARQPRFDTDQGRRREVTERFLAACATGDAARVMELLAPEVTAWSDGGGVVRAARRPLYGPDHVARWAIGVLAKPEMADVVAEFAWVNGQQGLLFSRDGVPIGALSLELRDGRVHELRTQLNPGKLSGLSGPAPWERLAQGGA